VAAEKTDSPEIPLAFGLDRIHGAVAKFKSIILKRPASSHFRGVTIIEVLVAALLIIMGLGGVFAINARCMHLLRSTRQVTAGSQVLQQRMEMLRSRPWPEISNAVALQTLLSSSTESEKELADAGVVETVNVTIPPTVEAVRQEKVRSFSVVRRRGQARVLEDEDLGDQPLLLFEIILTWRGVQKEQQRRQRAMICRTGLTRSGIFGSAFGRPEQTLSTLRAR
jgi:Tfp pilus assembly protein PilV